MHFSNQYGSFQIETMEAACAGTTQDGSGPVRARRPCSVAQIECDTERGKTMVNISLAWRALKASKGLKFDMDVDFFLLDT